MLSPARLAPLLLACLAAPAAAQSEAYQLTPPSGWTRSEENGALVLTPPGEDAQAARIIVLPPRPLEGDFEAQAARERAAAEEALGLRNPRLEPPLRTKTEAGEQLAHQARYTSDSGDRYAGFYSLGAKGAFALVVFYAANHDAYGRLASPASALFMGLRITPAAARMAALRTSPPGEAAPATKADPGTAPPPPRR